MHHHSAVKKYIDNDYTNEWPSELKLAIYVIDPLSEAEEVIAAKNDTPFVDGLLNIHHSTTVWLDVGSEEHED